MFTVKTSVPSLQCPLIHFPVSGAICMQTSMQSMQRNVARWLHGRCHVSYGWTLAEGNATFWTRLAESLVEITSQHRLILSSCWF